MTVGQNQFIDGIPLDLRVSGSRRPVECDGSFVNGRGGQGVREGNGTTVLYRQDKAIEQAGVTA